MERVNETNAKKSESVLVIDRIFNAPLELVWKAWSDEEHFKKWWGPKDFTCPFCEIDFKAGSRFLNCMRSPDGLEHWTTGTYKEIIPLRKIVYTSYFADNKGNKVHASYYGFQEDFPMEMKITITFEDYHGRTKMKLRHEGHPAGKISEMAQAGWNESLDKLAVSLV